MEPTSTTTTTEPTTTTTTTEPTGTPVDGVDLLDQKQSQDAVAPEGQEKVVTAFENATNTEVREPANDPVLGHDAADDVVEARENAQADARAEALANHTAKADK